MLRKARSLRAREPPSLEQALLASSEAVMPSAYVDQPLPSRPIKQELPREPRTVRRLPPVHNSSKSCFSQSNTRTTSRSGRVCARQVSRHRTWPTRCRAKWTKARPAPQGLKSKKLRNRLMRVARRARRKKLVTKSQPLRHPKPCQKLARSRQTFQLSLQRVLKKRSSDTAS